MADHHWRGGGRQFRQRHGAHDQELAEQPRADGGWNRRGEELESGTGSSGRNPAGLLCKLTRAMPVFADKLDYRYKKDGKSLVHFEY